MSETVYKVKVPDGSIMKIRGPEGVSDDQLLRVASGLWDQQRMANPTSGNGFLQNFREGMGKAFSDIGRGAGQLVGAGPSADETRENRRLDAPLMRTGGGVAGNISGNIAAFAPLAIVPGANTVAGAGALGATAAALQPTPNAGERVFNMALGGALGSGTQALGQYPMEAVELAKKYALAPFRGAKATVEPFYQGGREKIIGRTIRDVVGSNGPQIQQRLSSSGELVPGSLPTAAEVGESGGLAALQRAASASNPEAYTTRVVQQNEARVRALQDLAGTMGQRGAIEANRDTVASTLYKRAREQGVDQQMAKVMKPQIQNLLERAPNGIVEKAKELARLNGEVMDKEGSLNGLHWMKLAVDDLLSSGKQTGIGKQTERAITQYKSDLLSVIDELSPAYASARSTYQTMSRPVNQMDIAQEIADKSINRLTGQVQPQAYARALSDDTAQRATGFNKATLENTLEPKQLATLNALKGDLARSVAARDLGRGVGSDTVQKLSMSNIMERAGVPSQLANFPGVSRFGNWIYGGSDEQMRQMLAQTLLNPRETARLMGSVPPYAVSAQTDPALGQKVSLLLRSLALPTIPAVTE